MTVAERIAKLRALMAEKGIDAYVVPTADFHQSEYVDLIPIVKEKLETETNRSLEIAQLLLELLDTDEYRVIYDNCPLSIHIDAGNAPYGKTYTLIQSLVGWVHAMGYDCEVKPNAWTASTIADRISK